MVGFLKVIVLGEEDKRFPSLINIEDIRRISFLKEDNTAEVMFRATVATKTGPEDAYVIIDCPAELRTQIMAKFTESNLILNP